MYEIQTPDFQSAAFEFISGSPVGNDISVGDDPCCVHAKRRKDVIMQVISVEHDCDSMNENTEKGIVVLR
jgi:hypothetical protein